jgi:hypothetical protein
MKAYSWVFAVALLVVLAWGLEQVAIAPLQTGEVYPPYSSLRSDPMGAKALYESLSELPDLTVERLYKPRITLADSGAAILVLGTDPIGWSAVKDKTLEEYEKLVHRGDRLIIGFLPPPAHEESHEAQAAEERWHIKLIYRKTSGPASHIVAGPEWRPLAGHEAVERNFGAGSIVLVADSYPLSNEGLREARDSAFISQLLGSDRRIVFDENHFGVVETGSVTKLMRKYRLEGAVAMLALVAGLFLWRSASSFLPPRQTRASGAVTGRDSAEGLTALLHRGVPEKALLEVCYAEWVKTWRGTAPPHTVEEVVRMGKDNPVEGYRAACRVLTEKR